MPGRKTTAKSLVREALLLAACAALPAAAWAARPVPVFQVDVAGQSAPDLQQGMREALIRATGRRESATDPVFGALIADAPKYVQGYDRGPQGELQVIFDAAQVDQAIAALDRSTWDPNRPFTLVVIYPPPDQAEQAADQAGLEQAAEERGLPISIVPLPVVDSSGNLLAREALLEMTHQYGAEQLLVGSPLATSAPPPGAPPGAPPSAAPSGAAPSPGTAPAGATPAPAGSPAIPAAAPAAAPAAQPSPSAEASGEWRWTLYTEFTSQSWNGPLTAGIENTVDLLAPPAGPVAANVPGEAEIEIEGVSTLADYANIELMLGAVPGVSKADVRKVDGDSVVFEVTVRGGGPAIDRALSASPNFARVAPAGSSAPGGGSTPGGGTAGAAAPLVYRYRPG
jgi:Uncharacterized protein conserved in bacteria (DUF2066)